MVRKAQVTRLVLTGGFTIVVLSLWALSDLRPIAVSWNVRRNWHRPPMPVPTAPADVWRTWPYRQVTSFAVCGGTFSLQVDRATVGLSSKHHPELDRLGDRSFSRPGPHWSPVCTWGGHLHSLILDETNDWIEGMAGWVHEGLAADHYEIAGSDGDRFAGWTLSVPIWALAAVAGLGFAAVSARTVIAHRRRRADQCIACGYDLRATPDRCPECGATTSPTGS